MSLPGRTIGDQLYNLEKLFPKRSPNGYLHNDPSDRKRKTNAANLYLYIKSHDNMYSVHESEFHTANPRSPDEWYEWFRDHAYKGSQLGTTPYHTLGVIKGAILPGINIKTNQQWHVVARLGFSTHDIHISKSTKTRKKRNKTKPSRVENGQDNLRRRHRNGKRKAK